MRRIWRTLFAVIATFALVVSPLAAQAQSSPASDQIASLLGLPSQGSPLTTDPSALQQNLTADPGSNISEIAPPDPNNQGTASLSYPIEVPPGRDNTQPDLSITYNSSNADGWLGLGWDLSTPAIAVDTRWGVPRYDPNDESESYDLNGNELTPLAHTGQLQPRQSSPDGVTFHLRVEGSFYQIQRFGDNPTNYFWVVTDQSAVQYLYGATLQQTSTGCPPSESVCLVPMLDTSQVLADAHGNIYKWPLLEVADFSSNLTTYTYARVTDPVAPADPNSPDGTQLYLSKINYDGENDGTTASPGPYDVDFTLTQNLADGTPRPDVLSDAHGGFLTVTARLLSKITVSYNSQTIRSYDLSYAEGEFNKTLLQSITENGTDGSALATHSFTYYDNVHESDGSYNGFGSSSTWNTGSDTVDNTSLQDASALSGGVANSYDGHIYLGFNPVDSTKEGSVGVSVNYNHIDSNDTLAMIDINGDGLPDKVFESGGTIYYRLNQSAPGPNSSTTFGPAEPIAGLGTLGTQSSDTVAVGPEAYVGVSVLYNHAWTFTNSPIYFIDVNNDSLPDLVQNGHVLFDHLVNGVPVFNTDSSTTQVPIGTSQVDAAPLLPGLQSVYQQELAASPLVDTVRRWVAPYAGTISIGGNVNLIQDTSAARQSYTTADGVTVAIQHNGDQLWSQTIGATDYSSYTPSGVGSISVQAGDRIYFRVESGNDGKYDQVNWDPTISYTGVSAATDANGLNVYSFDAATDFTLAGRQHTIVTMPFDGTISLTGDLNKSGVTSDDVTLQVLQNGSAVFSKTIAWNKTGTITPPSSLTVKKGDTIELHVKLDSRVDLSQISWDPSLFYTVATDANEAPVTVKDSSGNYDVQLNPPYSMDIYPRSTVAQPDTGQTVSESGSVSVTPALTGSFTPNSPSGQIAFTVKTAKQLLGKETLTITSGQITACTIEAADGTTTDCGTSGWKPFSVNLGSGPVFFDFSITDPVLSDDVTAGSVAVTQGSTSSTYQAQVHGLYNPANTMDRGLFAQPYRGWAVAAYNGGSTSDGTALDESKLVYKQSDYPTTSNYYNPNLNIDPNTGYPTQNYDPNSGFAGAAGSSNPIDASAWALNPTPAHLDTLTNPPVQVPDQWLGQKDEIWVRAGTISSSRLTQDYVSVPTASGFQGAGAVSQMSETQQDAIQGGFLGISGSYSWGASDGNLDELDMNGDGFPDVVGSNSIQYTNTVGSLDATATNEPALNGNVRESHSIAWNIGAEGSPAKFTSDAKGNTNAPEQADPNSGTAKKASSGESGTAETATASAATRPQNAGGPGQDALIEAGGGSGGSPVQALTAGETGALTTRPGGSGSNGSAQAESQGEVTTTSSTSSARSTRGGSATGSEPSGDPPETASDGGQELNLGISGQYAQGETNQNGDHTVGGTLVNTDLIDINGDGLPDKVSTYSDGHMEVAFNLGYTFAAPVTWSYDAVTQRGTSQSFTVGGSVGFNSGDYGFGGGISGGQETDHDNGVLVDMNGDGLADYVTHSNGNLMVAINTGDGFAPPVVWHGADPNDIATSKSTNLGGGAYFTIGIGPLCEIGCYIIVNPGFDYSRSNSSQQLQLRDINGDGFPDDLSSTSNGSISVAQNNTGDTNLLKSVSRPLGASFTIEYTRAGNTTAAPASVWTMSRVTVSDNTPARSANTQVTTYSYANNFYDREERQVYGYDTVTSNQVDPSTGTVYRTIVDSYANDNYYDQGLLTSEKVEDGSGAIYTETDNSYTLLDETTNQTVTNGQAESLTLDEIFPELSTTTQSYYWGQATPGKIDTVTYQYDAHGNTTLISDSGDGPSNALTATLQYVSCPHYNIFNVPTSVIVTDANGKVLRHQEADVPCSEGAPTQIRQYLADGSSAQTDITYYDATGQHYNIKSVTSPPNLNGQRDEVDYTYDPTDTYVAQTTDSFGYVSTATYDPLYGAIASSTDINGNTTSYSYDVYGRLASVTGPYQQGTGKATITYDYSPPGASVPWAETHAIDTLHGGTIDSATFVDGLDRTVETKNDATVFTGAGSQPQQVMVVSGRVTFDFLGRVIEQYYPTTEPLGTPTTFNATYDSEPPATSSYDVLDRLTQYVAPNGSTTSYAYGFGPDRAGATQFVTTETDALGNKTATFTDLRQQVTSVDMFNGNQQVWTSYAYNPLNQLTSITDDQNHVTTMVYDTIGRETSINSPDSGLTTMSYDMASNLTSKVTADLAREGHGKAITYNYNYTHLIAINYPDFTGNNVSYTYGGPGAANNGAGQVIKTVDQAGQQVYTYGKIGEVTSEADTINPIQGQPLATYTSSYSYDALDRLASLTYPDGEVVTYGYGFGGLVNSVTGVKGSNNYAYASSLQYDKFGHLVFQQDGNGVQTVYSYTPTSQRLQNVQTGNSAGIFQNESYSYDAVGNVTGEKNDVPVPAAAQYGGPSTQSYSYDHLYRLTGASGTYMYAPNFTRSYTLALTYDSLGDILTNNQTDTITTPGGASQTQGPTTRSWSYAYTGSQPNAVSHLAGTGTLSGNSNGKGSGNKPAMAVTYSYDANGNETGWSDDHSGQRRTIVWDEENRVQSIANNGQTTSFRYDDQGNRIVTVGPGGVTTNVTPYYTVVNGANAVKNIFVGTQRLAQQAVTTDGSYESGQYFYHQDLTGSTAYVTDVNGNLFEHLEYFPTGETWVDEVSDPHVIPYLYTSHSFDSVTQLYYYGARYEDPRLDQFISPDPTLQSDPQTAIDDPMALNPYTYVDNNPVRYVDNDGEALTSAQEQFLRQAFANPQTRAAFLQASNKIITAYLSQQPAIVKLAASLPDKETLIAGYKKLATLSLPPLVEIGFKTNEIEVKIVGFKVPKSTARH